MNSVFLPNFLIVGAAKGGTTSLYYYLKQHPDVFLSTVKEPCFLCFDGNKPTYEVGRNTIFDFEEYQNLFKNSEKCKVRGEATAIYLYLYERTINNIKKFIPDFINQKIVIILRNPVERAFSQYMMNVRDLRENLSFEDALKIESERKAANVSTDFFYVDRGFYYEQVKAYMDNFKYVKVYLYDELVENPKLLMKDLCQFLEINSDFDFNTGEKFNVSGRPKYKFISKLIRQDSFLKKMLKFFLPKEKRKAMAVSLKNKMNSINLKKEKMNSETKDRLRDVFKNDIEKLQQLVQKDLSKWLQ